MLYPHSLPPSLPPSLPSSHLFLRLATELLYISPLHSEPWIAKAWQHTRDNILTSRERDKASAFVEKVFTFWIV